jgi:hypothetical protein
MGKGAMQEDNAWSTYYLTSSRLFAGSASGNEVILGAINIESDTSHVEVVCQAGGPSAGVATQYRWNVGLTSIESMRTESPPIPAPGIRFEGGMYVDVGASPGVTVVYKGSAD